jgi:hypothetical protein
MYEWRMGAYNTSKDCNLIRLNSKEISGHVHTKQTVEGTPRPSQNAFLSKLK